MGVKAVKCRSAKNRGGKTTEQPQNLCGNVNGYLNNLLAVILLAIMLMDVHFSCT